MKKFLFKVKLLTGVYIQPKPVMTPIILDNTLYPNTLWVGIKGTWYHYQNKVHEPRTVMFLSYPEALKLIKRKGIKHARFKRKLTNEH